MRISHVRNKIKSFVFISSTVSKLRKHGLLRIPVCKGLQLISAEPYVTAEWLTQHFSCVSLDLSLVKKVPN